MDVPSEPMTIDADVGTESLEVHTFTSYVPGATGFVTPTARSANARIPQLVQPSSPEFAAKTYVEVEPVTLCSTARWV